MRICSNCHHEVPLEASFCASCGKPLVTPPSGTPDPFIGHTFKGTYFVEMRVGGGGMGDVYRARHVTLDVPVALKILKRSLLSDPSIVQRFQREARAASRLRHPNVISVTDFGQTEDGTLYMAMEFLAGKSLARVIAEEFPLPEARVVRIGEQILAALSEAHASQILHRDLKPENVMLESRRSEVDAVKVLDFGIAKIQLGGAEHGTTLTQAGLVCGTPGYMSPEQWSGDPLDARSDLYAVGVVLYQMLTGHLPFDAQTPMEMMRKHLTEKIVPPSVRRGSAVSPELEALVMRALATAREERPASADEMRAALLACAISPEADRGWTEGAPQHTKVMPSPAGIPRTPAPRTSTPAPARASVTRSELNVGETEEGVPRLASEQPRRRRLLLVAAVAAPFLALLIAGWWLVATRPREPAPLPVTPILASPAPPVIPPAGEHPPSSTAGAVHGMSEAPASAPAVVLDAGTLPPSAPSGPGSGRTIEPAKNAQRSPTKPTGTAAIKPGGRLATKGPGSGPGARRPAATETALPGAPAPFESRHKLLAFTVPPATDGKGVLSVNAEPPGAEVVVNGQSYGTTPCELLVPAGDYDVVIRRGKDSQAKRCLVRAGTREPCNAIFRVD